MATFTNRQWPDGMIIPATARDKVECLYYGVAEMKIKELVDMVGQRDTVERAIDWIKEEMKSRVSDKYWQRNGAVFDLVLRNDVGKMAEEIYTKRKALAHD